jgi:hypothetical protein
MSYLEWMLPQNPTLFQSVSCKKLLKKRLFNGYLFTLFSIRSTEVQKSYARAITPVSYTATLLKSVPGHAGDTAG